MLKGKHQVRQTKSRKDALNKGFRSAFEHNVAKLLASHNIPYQYETETVGYQLKGKCVCAKCGSTETIENHTYLTDFVVKDIIIETKGFLSPKDRKKMKEVKKNTDKVILMVFQEPNKKVFPKSKTNKQTYCKWAEKNGFEWCSYSSFIYKLKSMM